MGSFGFIIVGRGMLGYIFWRTHLLLLDSIVTFESIAFFSKFWLFLEGLFLRKIKMKMMS
jgi:hypothetical protein